MECSSRNHTPNCFCSTLIDYKVCMAGVGMLSTYKKINHMLNRSLPCITGCLMPINIHSHVTLYIIKQHSPPADAKKEFPCHHQINVKRPSTEWLQIRQECPEQDQIASRMKPHAPPQKEELTLVNTHHGSIGVTSSDINSHHKLGKLFCYPMWGYTLRGYGIIRDTYIF